MESILWGWVNDTNGGGSNVHELTGWESLIGPTDLSQNTRQGDEDEMQGERRPTRRLA